jgi:hypothetical protein
VGEREKEKFDQRKKVKIGWLKNNIKRIPIISDDGRFACGK